MRTRTRLVNGLLGLGGVVLFLCGLASAGDVNELAKQFQKHIDFLAGDALEGRGVGSSGIEVAAEYVAGQFKEAGLEAGGVDGTYFQPFPISLERKLVEGNKLKFSGIDKELVQDKDFIPLSFSGSGSFSGKVVFCGYGIVNPDKGHDDFKDVDLKGRVALVFDGEPADWADKDGNPTQHSHRRNKLYNVKDRAGVAVLFVTLSKDDKDELSPFRSEGADDYGLPAIEVTRKTTSQIPFFSHRATATFEETLKNWNGEGRPELVRAFTNVDVDASGEVKFEKKTATTRNVLGALKGTGPQKDEWIVVGAHYDHLGVRMPMMRTFKDGKLVEGASKPEIHNGADDNASGVSGLIEIARLMTKQPKSNRSILFIAFSAEESGLQGSKYYADHPTQPLDHTVAMINMDMIGRPTSDSVIVFGAHSTEAFMPILESAGKTGGVKINPGVDSGGRSDHATFSRKKIPSLHFFSGNHPDYHKPTDDSNLINAEGGARIATVVLETAKALAGGSETLAYKEEVAAKSDPSNPHAAVSGSDPDKLPTFRVVMGLSPNYADDGQAGMGVDAVSPEGPADKAGVKAGDRIIRINNKPVANIYDYMASTRENKAGDTVDVVVSREGKEVALKVTLAGAR